MIEFIKHVDGHSSQAPLSPAARVGNLVFVAGQVSADNNGTIVPDTFEGEFRRAMENLRRILRSAGSDLDRVVQVRGYVKDPANVPLYNTLYREYFKVPYPARTTLTGCLAKIQFEIDCIAVTDV